MNIMKKQLLLIGLILAVFTGYSQEIDDEMVTKQDSTVEDSICHHRINIHVGSGWNNNIYRRVLSYNLNGELVRGIKPVYSIGDVFEIGYTYFFNENWGLGIGAGVHHIAAWADMNFRGRINKFNDPYFAEHALNPSTTYDYIFETKGVVERQQIWAIEVPLTAQFEKKFTDACGIYAQLGVKGYFPIYNRSWMKKGTIVTTGYEPFTDALYEQAYCINHGFGEFEVKGNGSTKLRCSVDLQADFGGIFTINNKTDFYVGVWCSYGFLDVLPKAENRHNLVEPTDNATNLNYNGLLGSNNDILFDQNQITSTPANLNSEYTSILREEVIGNFHWHNLQLGVKLGIHIKPCGKVEPSDRKKFYRKMTEAAQKYLDDTCNACDKNTEYIYIVPVCPDQRDNGQKLTKKEKEELEDFAEDLESIKILFDLDKDVPKIAEYGDYIDKCAKKLKQHPDWHLDIEGYTCSLGPEEHNRDLALRRAESIKRLFVEEKGVNPDQLHVITYTANDPENSKNITDPSKEEHRAAIIRIRVK